MDNLIIKYVRHHLEEGIHIDCKVEPGLNFSHGPHPANMSEYILGLWE